MQMIPVLWRGAKIRCRDLQGLFVELCFVFRTIWSFLHFLFFLLQFFALIFPVVIPLESIILSLYSFSLLFTISTLFRYSFLSLSLACEGGRLLHNFPVYRVLGFFGGEGGRGSI